MLKLSKVEVTEASRVFGDMAEKVAFNVDLNPVNIISSALGGYAATRTYDTIQDNRLQEEASKKTLEQDYYANIQHILRDTKIIFTPINVVYSVNGQVFEIIKTDEMSQPMRQAFLAKDAQYFKSLLLNKMNMELQLAEQIFARNLIKQQLPQQTKEAKHVSIGWLEKVSFDAVTHQLTHLEKTAAPFAFEVNFDSIRPFDSVGDWKLVEKVANYFTLQQTENVSHKDLAANVKVGFLPDRVIFTYHGQLFEQIPVLHMNDEGYAAFKKRNKNFFLNYLLDETKRIEAEFIKEIVENEVFPKKAADDSTIEETDETDESWLDELTDLFKAVPSDGKEIDELSSEEDSDYEEDEETEKTAASLEDVRSEWDETFALEKESVDLWRDLDVHPIAYDYLMETRYGENWHEVDLSITLRQIIDDFNLEEIHVLVSDKIAFLQMVQNENHSIYQNAFSFEKFVRAMNSKTINFTEYELGLEFEELIFAFDLVSSLSTNEHVFYEFGEDVPNYIAKCLKTDGIRYISDQLYDETNEAEKDFFDDVNGFLMRLWQEEDSLSLMGTEAEQARQKTVHIRDVAETCIRDYAEYLEPTNPYTSTEQLLREKSLFFQLTEEEFMAVRDLVARHVVATVFLELKQQELTRTMTLLDEAGVMNE